MPLDATEGVPAQKSVPPQNGRNLTDYSNSTNKTAQPCAASPQRVIVEIIKLGNFYIYQVGELYFKLDKGPDKSNQDASSLVLLSEDRGFGQAFEVEGLDINCPPLVARESFIGAHRPENGAEILLLSPLAGSQEISVEEAKLLDFIKTENGFYVLIQVDDALIIAEIDICDAELVISQKLDLKPQVSYSTFAFCGPETLVALSPNLLAKAIDISDSSRITTCSVQFTNDPFLVRYGSECLIADLANNILTFFLPSNKTAVPIDLKSLGLDTQKTTYSLFNCSATKLSSKGAILTLALQTRDQEYLVCVLDLTSDKVTRLLSLKSSEVVLNRFALKVPSNMFLTSATTDRQGNLWLSVGNFWDGFLLRVPGDSLKATSDLTKPPPKLNLAAALKPRVTYPKTISF